MCPGYYSQLKPSTVLLLFILHIILYFLYFILYSFTLEKIWYLSKYLTLSTKITKTNKYKNFTDMFLKI